MSTNENKRSTHMARPDVWQGPVGLASLEVNYDDAWTLWCAALDGELETVKKLVAKDPRLIQSQFRYHCPLDMAIYGGHNEIVRLLIDAGTELTAKWGWYGWQRMIDIADEMGYDEIHGMLQSRIVELYQFHPDIELMIQALCDQDIDRMRQLVDEDPNRVHFADTHGNTALHWAVVSRQIPMIDLLVERGADVNRRNGGHCMPHQVRIWTDLKREMIRGLEPIEHYRNARKRTLELGAAKDFITIIGEGDLELVEKMLLEDSSLVHEINGHLPSPLAKAADNLQMTQLLLDHGADPNMCEFTAPFGCALFNATCNKNFQVAELLLRNGADPMGYSDSSGDYLFNVSRWKDEEKKRQWTDLHVEYSGKEHIIIPQRNDDPPVEETRAKVLEVLSRDEITPWQVEHLLEVILHIEDAELLAAYIDRLGDVGIKEVSLTDARGHKGRVFDFLKAHGANTRPIDTDPKWLGRTILHSTDDTSLVVPFVAAGGNINSINFETGHTALSNAVRGNNVGMVRELLQHGADPSLPLRYTSKQPLSIAVANDRTEIANLLREHLDSSNPTDNRVACPMCQAINSVDSAVEVPDGWYGQLCSDCNRSFFVNCIGGKIAAVHQNKPHGVYRDSETGREISLKMQLFDASGNHVASQMGDLLYSPTGQHVGQYLHGHSFFVDLGGNYLGEIVSDNRLLRNTASLNLKMNFGEQLAQEDISPFAGTGQVDSLELPDGYEAINFTSLVLASELNADHKFWAAIKNGDTESAITFLVADKSLAGKNFDPESLHTDGFPLYHATKQGNLELAKLLLESGADPDAKLDTDDPREVGMPLLNALQNGHYDVVHLILDYKPTLNAHPYCSTSFVDQLFNNMWNTQRSYHPGEAWVYKNGASDEIKGLFRLSYADYLKHSDSSQEPQRKEADQDNVSPNDSQQTELKLLQRVIELGGQPSLFTLVRHEQHELIRDLLLKAPTESGSPMDRPQGRVFDNICNGASWCGYPKTISQCIELCPELFTADVAKHAIERAIRSHNRDGGIDQYHDLIMSALEFLKIKDAVRQSYSSGDPFFPLHWLAEDFIEPSHYGFKCEPLSTRDDLVRLGNLFVSFGYDVNAINPKTGWSAFDDSNPRRRNGLRRIPGLGRRDGVGDPAADRNRKGIPGGSQCG